MELTDLHVGRQLNIVSNLPSGIPAPPNVAQGTGPTAVPGSVWADGHLHVGMPVFLPLETAVGFTRPPAYNAKAASVKSIVTITSRGFPPTPLDVVIGDLTGPVGVAAHALVVNMIVDTTMSIVSPLTNHVGTFKKIGLDTLVGTEITKAVRAIFAKEVKIGAFCSAGARTQNGVLANNGLISNPISATPVVIGRATGNKKFDISHPNKKGWRLSHVCLEGPTSDVYVRGKLKDTNVIELPNYWDGLVDPETIDISLTPIGSYQELYVEKIEWGNKVTIKNNAGGPINCSYVIYGERCDIEKNIPEYEGESPSDYPGDVNQSSIAGYHYDVRG